MGIAIRTTLLDDVEQLLVIQKAAFKPLYEKFHDEGNPYLRGAEDILWRLNKNNRYYTILYDNKIVGGIFYRLRGRLGPDKELDEGEYYLGRLYVHPDYQNKKIAREAILLCEEEFADAKVYYVDFPEEMEKNRRCYVSTGYCDSGENLDWREGVPKLAMYKKTVDVMFDPTGVSMPMIYEVERGELCECADVIRQSFATVAESFGITENKCPSHPSFILSSILEGQKDRGDSMFALYAGKKIIGYMSLSKESDNIFELHNLCVLPAYRHKGFGKKLIDHAKEVVKKLGGSFIEIYIIENNTKLTIGV